MKKEDYARIPDGFFDNLAFCIVYGYGSRQASDECSLASYQSFPKFNIEFTKNNKKRIVCKIRNKTIRRYFLDFKNKSQWDELFHKLLKQLGSIYKKETIPKLEKE